MKMLEDSGIVAKEDKMSPASTITIGCSTRSVTDKLSSSTPKRNVAKEDEMSPASTSVTGKLSSSTPKKRKLIDKKKIN